MNIDKYRLLVSVGLGLLLAFISVISMFGGAMDSSNPPLITKVLLWNIVLAVYLIGAGILPACENCELAILIYVIFYGFLIGLIGYSLAIWGGILLIKNKRE